MNSPGAFGAILSAAIVLALKRRLPVCLACVAPMQASITTSSPPDLARAAVSSFAIPLCSHSALAPILTAS